MGNNVLQIGQIDKYLKRNGIFNINVLNHIQNNSAQIQNLIDVKKNFRAIGSLHNQIYNIIKKNNLLTNYIENKPLIINKIISENKNLKKQKSKMIQNYKKKITDAISSEQLKNIVEFEIN